MRGTGVWAAVVAAACAVGLVVFVGAARAAASTLVVDEGAGQCSNATYSDIDSAIADADPGDTILVCPGTYPAVTVDKRLTLRGFTPNLSQPSACASTA